MDTTAGLTQDRLMEYLDTKRAGGDRLLVDTLVIVNATEDLQCSAEDFRTAIDNLAEEGKVVVEKEGAKGIELLFPQFAVPDFDFTDDEPAAEDQGFIQERAPDIPAEVASAPPAKFDKQRRRRKRRTSKPSPKLNRKETVVTALTRLRRQEAELAKEIAAKSERLAKLQDAILVLEELSGLSDR